MQEQAFVEECVCFQLYVAVNEQRLLVAKCATAEDARWCLAAPNEDAVHLLQAGGIGIADVEEGVAALRLQAEGADLQGELGGTKVQRKGGCPVDVRQPFGAPGTRQLLQPFACLQYLGLGAQGREVENGRRGHIFALGHTHKRQLAVFKDEVARGRFVCRNKSIAQRPFGGPTAVSQRIVQSLVVVDEEGKAVVALSRENPGSDAPIVGHRFLSVQVVGSEVCGHAAVLGGRNEAVALAQREQCAVGLHGGLTYGASSLRVFWAEEA